MYKDVQAQDLVYKNRGQTKAQLVWCDDHHTAVVSTSEKLLATMCIRHPDHVVHPRISQMRRNLLAS